MKDEEEFTLLILQSTAQISANDWQNCAGDDNPFLSYDFFLSLEKSGCLRKENGWQTCHGVLQNKNNETIAILPGFLKYHSLGEYVFDQNWAQAYQAAGGQYYPKYLSAIPFTPASTKKLLINKTLNEQQRKKALQQLVKAPKGIMEKLGLSSFHANFLLEEEAIIFAKNNFLIRNDAQYHWHNNDYKCFDDFLDSLTSRKRKTIKKERHQALNGGDQALNVEIVTGDELSELHWDHFYEFYVSTSMNKWGRPYLTRDFFSLIGEKIPEKIVLIFAKKDDKYIAGALNFLGKNTLYGRNWGAREHHSFLHFELCYYQAIEFAIKHGLKKVEAGAQGEHKIARGYIPQKTYSAHAFHNQGFHIAVEKFLNDETKAIEDYIQNASTQVPFKNKQ